MTGPTLYISAHIAPILPPTPTSLLFQPQPNPTTRMPQKVSKRLPGGNSAASASRCLGTSRFLKHPSTPSTNFLGHPSTNVQPPNLLERFHPTTPWGVPPFHYLQVVAWCVVPLPPSRPASVFRSPTKDDRLGQGLPNTYLGLEKSSKNAKTSKIQHGSKE